MTVRMNCPACEVPNTISDDKRGRKVRCRECETSFMVPAEKRRRDDEDAFQERPRRKAGAPSRRRDDDFDDDEERPVPKRKKSGGRKESGAFPVALVIGGIAVVLLLCLVGGSGIGALVFFRSRAAQAAQREAQVAQVVQAKPAEAKPEQVKNDPGEARRHVEPGGGFSFVPPSGWKIQPLPGMRYMVAVDLPANGFAANMNVVDERFNGPVDGYVQVYINTLQGLVRNLRVVQREPFTTTAGLRGARVIFESDQFGHRLRQTCYFFGRGDSKFVVTCTALANGGVQLDPVFETSMKTFRFDR